MTNGVHLTSDWNLVPFSNLSQNLGGKKALKFVKIVIEKAEAANSYQNEAWARMRRKSATALAEGAHGSDWNSIKTKDRTVIS